ncbi:hypothetical protein HYFRA_00005478 [Hymenoscyphus fraxineus]|uniref:DUF6590 domain-containing protein n=1 Tax=Hymenoscyphus fraxineus TaxID=746836 RepID=A0A9N9KRI4_9HELO|nr:hypothetical protein HYFRA_00005478 [Hymenoscyphus fraxineus]
MDEMFDNMSSKHCRQVPIPRKVFSMPRTAKAYIDPRFFLGIQIRRCPEQQAQYPISPVHRDVLQAKPPTDVARNRVAMSIEIQYRPNHPELLPMTSIQSNITVQGVMDKLKIPGPLNGQPDVPNDGSSSASGPTDAPSISIARRMNTLSLDDHDKTRSGYGYPVPLVPGPYTITSSSTNAGFPARGTDNTQANMNYSARASSEYGAQDAAVNSPQEQTESQSDTHRLVTGTPGDAEKLDPRYQVRNHDYKKFFKPGRVFSTLWTVPASGMTNKNETFISVVKYGEKVHTKIRRFVVVTFKQSNKRCTCLPVTSYEGRGYKKPDIDTEEHGPIFSTKKPPRTETGVTKKPLRVILSKNADPLKDPSLVNYGCIYTVETNVKVMDVGVLDSDSLECLQEYYAEVNFSTSRSAADTGIQQKEQYLTGVGSSFGATSQTSHNQVDSTTTTKRDRTVSFSDPPSNYSSSSDTYRVPIGHTPSQIGYGSTSYNAQLRPESTSMASSSTYPLPTNVQYGSTPHTSTDNRYSTINNPQATITYSSTAGLGSNPRFSPTTETSGYNYTTQPQSNSNVSTTPHSRSGYGDNRTSYQSMGTNPSPYQMVPQSAGQGYSTSYSTNPRSPAADSTYSYSLSPPACSGSYSSRVPPSQDSYGNSVHARNEDDEDIELPTRGEIEASRQHRSRRESVSRPSRHDKGGSSRQHDRSDRDRKERKK